MRKIIIDKNYWQTRIAITKEKKLQNIYFHSPLEKTIEKKFFKGTFLLSSLQAPAELAGFDSDSKLPYFKGELPVLPEENFFAVPFS